MIFIRSAFLIIVLMNLNISAQISPETSEQNNEHKGFKFDEYGNITTKKLEKRLHNFFKEIVETNGRGRIIIFAPNQKKMDQRFAQLRYFFRLHDVGGFFDRFDISKITLDRIRKKHEKTEFWVIPKGSDPIPFVKSIK